MVNAAQLTPRILSLMSPADRAIYAPSAPATPPANKTDTRLEKDLLKLCLWELSRRGIVCLHLSPRAREHAGWPDLTFVVPPVLAHSNGGGGVPWAVELKAEGGRLSAEQERTLADMARNGWRTLICRSYTNFRTTVFGD